MTILQTEQPNVKHCSELCDFCSEPAQIAFAYQTDQPETLACVPCAVERNAEVGSIFMGRDVNGKDEWESIANICDELRLARQLCEDATTAANLNAESYRKQRESHSIEVGALYKDIHDLRAERNRIFAELDGLKRGEVSPELSVRIDAFILENLASIVVENGGSSWTLAQLLDDGNASAAAKHIGVLRNEIVRTHGRSLPKRLCFECNETDCSGCGGAENCAFTLPVQLREVLKERRIA